MSLQLHPELHVTRFCQLMNVVITKPELLGKVSKPTFVISPVPVEVLPRFSIITAPLNNLNGKNIIRIYYSIPAYAQKNQTARVYMFPMGSLLLFLSLALKEIVISSI